MSRTRENADESNGRASCVASTELSETSGPVPARFGAGRQFTFQQVQEDSVHGDHLDVGVGDSGDRLRDRSPISADDGDCVARWWTEGAAVNVSVDDRRAIV